MDRAAKVKQYTQKRKKNYGRRSSQLQAAGIPKAGLFALILSAAALAAVLSLLLQHKSGESDLTYVTGEEFASMLSFLTEDLPEEWTKKPDSFLTRSQMKEFVQTAGLSGAIPLTGGNDKMERAEVMNCYRQILDLLDLGGSVKKKTLLMLSQDGTVLKTQEGDFQIKAGPVKLKPFYTYQAYCMEQTVLGIDSESEKTIALKNVQVQNVTDSKTEFLFEKQEYEVLCKDTGALSPGSSCTLCIKGGRVTKVKNIKQPERAKAQKSDETAEKLPETVKVLLLNQGNVHYDQVNLKCDGNYEITKNKKKTKYRPSDRIQVKKLKLKKGKSITVNPLKQDSRLFLTDQSGSEISKGYLGSMTIYRDAEGYYIVNKVPAEKYLYSVVASEMPSSFGAEALKAQAVCARSYLYRQTASNDYSEYHAQIDDSTNYQVYNKSDVSAEDIAAVEETAGEVMYVNDEIVNAYYFSSSHGYTSSMEIWNQDEAAYPYLKSKSLMKSKQEGRKKDLSDEKVFKDYIASAKHDAYDSSSRYYRWKAEVELSADVKELKQRISQRQKLNPDNFTFYLQSGKKRKKTDSMKGFGGVKNMYCSKRGSSGAVLELVIQFEFGKAVIKSEYNIRYIIGCAMEKITYADGTQDTSVRFLPSAYFSIDFNKKSKRYLLCGGGNGHGMGMSQYGAAGMNAEGWDYRKILKFFYDGAQIKKVY